MPPNETLLGVRLKWVALLLLVLQTTALVMLLRYSRVASSGGDKYLVSTAVVAAEALKILASLALFFLQTSSTGSASTTTPGTSLRHRLYNFAREVETELTHRDMIKLAIPGILYLIQNNLLFVALSNLEAAVYQVTYQLKILTTAFFTVTIMGRRLTLVQIFALLLLTGGVSLVQLAELTNTDDGKNKGEASSSGGKRKKEGDALLGLICVLLACFSSGFAGVYLEKVMKRGRPVSIWVRNIQLGVFGVIFGMLGIITSRADREVVFYSGRGFFHGYTPVVWLVVAIQVVGGLLIAAVIKYADNILKGFATSISIVLSSVLSIWLFDFRLTFSFILGAALVVVAVFLFSATPSNSGGGGSKKEKEGGEEAVADGGRSSSSTSSLPSSSSGGGGGDFINNAKKRNEDV